VLRVIRGDATPEEIAALVAVVMARASASSPPRPGDRSAWSSARSSAWSDRTRQLRVPIRPAPGAWRRSALPG
jgi:hypothetical protein